MPHRLGVLGGVLTLAAASALASLSATGAQAVDQTVAITALPPIAQPGATPAESAKALTPVSVRVTPAEAGRRVSLYRWNWKTGKRAGWESVGDALTDARGIAEFVTTTGNRPGLRGDFYARVRASGTLPELVTPSAATPAWNDADFGDEFSGATLGSAWQHRAQNYLARTCAKGSPDAVSVGYGTLRLSSMIDPQRIGDECYPTVTGPNVMPGPHPFKLDANIGTHGSFDFTYGVAAARMRLQPKRGQHAAFWLQPTDGSLNPEVDVIEYFGLNPVDPANRGLSSGVHYHDGVWKEAGGNIPNNPAYLDRANPSDSWSTGFHVFSVQWSPTEYVFRIDGRETSRVTQGVGGPFTKPLFLTLSMLTSNFENGRITAAELPQTAEVDWVRVWELPAG